MYFLAEELRDEAKYGFFLHKERSDEGKKVIFGRGAQ